MTLYKYKVTLSSIRNHLMAYLESEGMFLFQFQHLEYRHTKHYKQLFPGYYLQSDTLMLYIQKHRWDGGGRGWAVQHFAARACECDCRMEPWQDVLTMLATHLHLPTRIAREQECLYDCHKCLSCWHHCERCKMRM